MNKNNDDMIRLAKQAGRIARESAFATRRAYALDRVTFPRVLVLVLAPRRDGTLTAARRSFAAGLHGD